jgi:Zn-dependent dipeptidase, microsomal dipeptidase homolog
MMKAQVYLKSSVNVYRTAKASHSEEYNVRKNISCHMSLVRLCSSSFAAHINHIRDVAGVNYVGIGAGYDGIN